MGPQGWQLNAHNREVLSKFLAGAPLPVAMEDGQLSLNFKSFERDIALMVQDRPRMTPTLFLMGTKPDAFYQESEGHFFWRVTREPYWASSGGHSFALRNVLH